MNIPIWRHWSKGTFSASDMKFGHNKLETHSPLS